MFSWTMKMCNKECESCFTGSWVARYQMGYIKLGMNTQKVTLQMVAPTKVLYGNTKKIPYVIVITRVSIATTKG